MAATTPEIEFGVAEEDAVILGDMSAPLMSEGTGGFLQAVILRTRAISVMTTVIAAIAFILVMLATAPNVHRGMWAMRVQPEVKAQIYGVQPNYMAFRPTLPPIPNLAPNIAPSYTQSSPNIGLGYQQATTTLGQGTGLFWPVTSTRVTTTNAPQACGWTEQFINYPGNDIRSVNGVMSAGACCQECVNEPACLAWTWGQSTCFLKGGRPRPVLTKVKDVHFTSGQPTQLNRFISTVLAKPGQSLFCFSLMLPFSYEESLLLWQFQQGVSIFACDEYAVYSNLTLEAAPGVQTLTVASNLVCSKGGEFKTALNTDIFLAVWARVVGDGRFRYHDWTVKVDPDCVFFPVRLRSLVMNHREGPGGIYINNCKMGMHGPLEVFSRNAVGVWWQGVTRCQQHFGRLCSGPCKWGEDMFIDQCLMKVLHVRREFDGLLLQEDHCDPPPGWMSCQNNKVIAFHPFKSVGGYQACRQGSLR